MTLTNDELEIRLYIVASLLGSFCGLSLVLIAILIVMLQRVYSKLNKLKMFVYTQQQTHSVAHNYLIETPGLPRIGTNYNASRLHHPNDNLQELIHANLNRELRSERLYPERSRNSLDFNNVLNLKHSEDPTYFRETPQEQKSHPALNRPGNSNRMFAAHVENVGY